MATTRRAAADTDKNYLVDHWNPFLTYTCTLAQIKAWFLANGERSFYNGSAWTLKYKRLCPGVYKVQFVDA